MIHETIYDLIEAKEGENYQFKEAKERFSYDEAVQICCALSNGGGGKLVLGITDKRPREVVGSKAFAQPERTRSGLINKLHVRVDFQIYKYINDRRVLVFDVACHPVGIPVQVDGIAWWYKGEELVPMPPEVLRAIYAESGHDFSADICPDATIDDLDIDAIEVFRREWLNKSGNMRIKNMTVEQLLRDCGVVSDKGVTYAALILFGTRTAIREHIAQAEIIYEYRATNAAGPADYREEFQIGFFACFDKIWELIDARNTMQHYQEGFLIRDIITFNERVARESILNAAGHRNYQQAGSIFVRQYRDRLVVDSPGGFPTEITIENILDKQSPRNRRIAEVFALCGLVERAGQGMNLIYELSIRDGKALPDFATTDEHFVCITLNCKVLDAKMAILMKKISDEQHEAMSTDDYITVNALFYKQNLTRKLKERAKRLVDIGITEHLGQGKYIISRELYNDVGASDVHSEVNAIDRDAAKKRILEHIENNGDVGTPLLELHQALPEYTRNQIRVFLRELRRKKKIHPVGKTSAAKWYIGAEGERE